MKMQRSLAVEPTRWDVVIAICGLVGTGGLATLVKLWLRRNEQAQKVREWEVTKMREDVDRLLGRITSLEEVKIALEAQVNEQNRVILELSRGVLERDLKIAHLEGQCADQEKRIESLTTRLNARE